MTVMAKCPAIGYLKAKVGAYGKLLNVISVEISTAITAQLAGIVVSFKYCLTPFSRLSRHSEFLGGRCLVSNAFVPRRAAWLEPVGMAKQFTFTVSRYLLLGCLLHRQSFIPWRIACPSFRYSKPPLWRNSMSLQKCPTRMPVGITSVARYRTIARCLGSIVSYGKSNLAYLANKCFHMYIIAVMSVTSKWRCVAAV